MTVSDVLIPKILALPPERQRDVLDFVEKLESEAQTPPHERQSAYGLCADLKVDLSFEDFKKNREEMWGRSTEEELS